MKRTLTSVKAVSLSLVKSKAFWRLMGLLAVTMGLTQGMELAGALGDVLNEA